MRIVLRTSLYCTDYEKMCDLLFISGQGKNVAQIKLRNFNIIQPVRLGAVSQTKSC